MVARCLFIESTPQLDLILQLYDIGCIMFGNFVQASGQHFTDLRKIISNPKSSIKFSTPMQMFSKILAFDRIAGIPYGSLPTATGLALSQSPDDLSAKKSAHGTRRLIEGNFHPGETVVVVDDILISGAMEGAQKLESAGLNVHDIVVIMDKGLKTGYKWLSRSCFNNF